MARILVDVDETELDGVAGVVVTCGRCGYEVEVFGTTERSMRRGCAMLRDECPEGMDNFYYFDDDDEL